jgi:hypothetical protein
MREYDFYFPAITIFFCVPEAAALLQLSSTDFEEKRGPATLQENATRRKNSKKCGKRSPERRLCKGGVMTHPSNPCHVLTQEGEERERERKREE